MNLLNVVMKNMRHNLKSYALYIASISFSILIYFTFLSLQYNNQIEKALNTEDKLKPLLIVASMILILFITVFISYSNTFFIKKRKQEIGLYSLFGVQRKKIAKMLFYENILLSLIALVIGLVLGELFSIFFSMLLVKLLGFSFSVSFALNGQAVIQTIIVFTILACLTSFQGSRVIYRFRLLDLFQAKHKGQAFFKPSVWTALLSVILLVAAYRFLLSAAGSDSWDNHFGRNLQVTFLLLISGTYLLFRSGCGFFIQWLQKRKPVYYKWRNLLTFTQLKDRLKSNAIMLTTIAIMNSVVLIAFGFTYTLYYNTQKTLNDNVPYSYQYNYLSDEADQQFTAYLKGQKQFPLQFDERFQFIEVPGDPSDLAEVPDGFHYENKFTVLSNSMYNKLAKVLDRKTISGLGADGVMMTGRNFIGSQNDDSNTGWTIMLDAGKREIKLQVKGTKTEATFNADIPPAVLIVSDEVFEDLKQTHPVQKSHVFKVENEKDSAPVTAELSKRVAALSGEDPEKDPIQYFMSYSGEYQAAKAIYGLLTFISGFLGLVFLAATGSIIYFKMLTEATEDKQRYETLKNIGMSRKNIFKVIARQYGIIFVLPLIIGILNSSLMLGTLSKAMDIHFFAPQLATTILYTLLYALYYVGTIVSARRLANC